MSSIKKKDKNFLKIKVVKNKKRLKMFKNFNDSSTHYQLVKKYYPFPPH